MENQEDTYRMPFQEKLAGVVTTPRRVMESVSFSDTTPSNWLFPLLLYVVVSIITIQVVSADPVLSLKFKEAIEEVLRPTLEAQGNSGVFPEGFMTLVHRFITPGTIEFFIAQSLGIVIGASLTLPFLGFIFWQIGKSAMGGDVSYAKVVEVVGFAYVIAAIERVLTTGLMLATGSILVTPSLGLLFIGAGEVSMLFAITSRLNFFTVWQLGIIGLGLSFLYEKDFPKVFVLLLAFWLLWSLITVLPLFGIG